MKITEIFSENETRFLDSSHDRGTNRVLITFIGRTPSKDEILDYVDRQYQTTGMIVNIEEPSTFRGMSNPGTVVVALN